MLVCVYKERSSEYTSKRREGGRAGGPEQSFFKSRRSSQIRHVPFNASFFPFRMVINAHLAPLYEPIHTPNEKADERARYKTWTTKGLPLAPAEYPSLAPENAPKMDPITPPCTPLIKN
jgi:hypothetical protein